MVRGHTKKSAKLLAALSALSLAGTMVGTGVAASAAATPGVTSNSILFGSHQPLTGAAAPGYDEIAPAIQAFFNYVNAKGGVYGRKLTLQYEDDGYNPANTVTVVQKQVLQDGVFAELAGLGTPTHQAVVSFLNAHKVPDLFVASGCDCWNLPTKYPMTYGYQPDYVIEGKIIANYIKTKFAGDKVGVIYQNDDLGTGGLQGLKDVLPASEIVSAQPYDVANLATAGLASQVLALKAAGAQVIVSFTIPAALAIQILTQTKIGFQPAALMTSSIVGDVTTMNGLLQTFAKAGGSAIDTNTANALLNGIYTLGYAAPLSNPTDPWIKLFTSIHAKYDANQPIDSNMVFGMTVGYATWLALRAAGKNLTRAGLINAMNTQAGKFSGPWLAKFGYSASDHLGVMGEEVAQFNAGSIGAVTGVYTSTPSAKSAIKVTKSAETGVPKALA